MRPATTALGRLEEQQRHAALSLLRRLPPQDLQRNFSAIAELAPNLESELASHVDGPLQLLLDDEANRYFIACDYNFDGSGKYRSPWTSNFFSAEGEGDQLTKSSPQPLEQCRPSDRLRRLEKTFNEVFDAYKTSYYEGGVSSVYLWDLEEGFAGAFVIHKELSGDPRGLEHALWESVHVIDVKETNNWVEYKLTTSVHVHMHVGPPDSGKTALGAHLTRQADEKKKKAGAEEVHVLQIGRMIEDMEISIRQSLEAVHLAKQREILSNVRSFDAAEQMRLPSPPKPVPADKGSVA
eukprot:gnl/TRDRNA2_/TRDRNA2_109736_c0_seq1.p1 gnl/TRDRNA2_/TRDRNA2_109736_c0~~gnl/TRDRNA2_/TRDRNA2_109736_c0_seq1.p1  ORF type:complete len:295 (+),score=67.54 gnl/TRDRNA2_/TRDRNA2_109736_c0_seq1:66-950(+)